MKFYEIPAAELLEFESEDIMRTSPEDGQAWSQPENVGGNNGDVQDFAFDD